MADTQASAFGDIPALDLTNDRIPILDVSATGNDKNKLISPTTLMASKLDLAGGTVTGQLVLSVNGAASTPPQKLTGTWFTGGSATTTKPQLLIEPTGATSTAWSTSGTGIGVNAASGFAGNLLDLQVNGVSEFRLAAASLTLGRSSGGAVAQLAIIGTSGTGGNRTILLFDTGTPSVVVSNSGRIGFSSSADCGSLDTFFCRDAAGILALKNAANPQTFRVYGTTTGSKYLQIEHDGTNAKITASSGNVHISNIPTSNPGPGILWNNAGTLAIGT